jgi:hypothetical protein
VLAQWSDNTGTHTGSLRRKVKVALLTTVPPTNTKTGEDYSFFSFFRERKTTLTPGREIDAYMGVVWLAGLFDLLFGSLVWAASAICAAACS